MTAGETRSRYLRIAIAFYLIWTVLFILEGFYAVTLPTTDLTSRIDDLIPLVPGFVWIYMFCYVFPFVTLFVVKDWHRFNRALLSIALCTLLAFVGHLAIPVAFPRPSLDSSVSARMLAFIYENDFKPGAQNFPSLHVAVALIIYFTCRKQGLKRPAEGAILVMALLIILSTVFIKQHLFVDLVGGLILAVIVWVFIAWAYRRYVPSVRDAPLHALALLTRKLGPTYVLCTFLLMAVCLAQEIR